VGKTQQEITTMLLCEQEVLQVENIQQKSSYECLEIYWEFIYICIVLTSALRKIGNMHLITFIHIMCLLLLVDCGLCIR